MAILAFIGWVAVAAFVVAGLTIVILVLMAMEVRKG